MTHSLFLLLALPFVSAAVIALSVRASRALCAVLAGAAPVLGVLLLGAMTPAISSGHILRNTWVWAPQIHLDFALRMDGLAWMFAGLVLGIGALVVLYAHYYLSAKDNPRRFYSYLLLFMGAMLGMVLSGNLLLLVVFWELTSISSFLLIGFWSYRKQAREGAAMALIITGTGGLALLAGAVLLGRIVGSFDLDTVLASGQTIRSSALYPYALLLILGGIFTKSAQFPFHFWLPHAMAAPTPVSAYLHSATMVKAGVFLLARLHPALSGTELFFWVVSSVGAVTLLVGAFNAVSQHDVKGLLAYSTISHLGLITLLFGLSAPMAVVAGVFHILNHALFKASLFMAAGIIDHECHSRDLRHLGGLRKLMPITSILALTATLAMAGLPPLNGFLSKEMLFEQTLALSGNTRTLFSILALAGALLGIMYSLRFVHDAFFGEKPRALTTTPHDPPYGMLLPVGLLVFICLAIGFVPVLTASPILTISAGSILGESLPDYHLALWHGVNGPLLMSIIGAIAGVALYFVLRKLYALNTVANFAMGKYLFRRSTEILFHLAHRFTHAVANGSLQRMLLALVLVAVIVAAAPYLAQPAWPVLAASQPISLLGWVFWLIMLVCALSGLFLYRQRLLAVIVIGGTGLMVAMVFVFLSAPDLALTQLMVEMVTLALMLLGMNYLPAQSPVERTPWRVRRDALIALIAGVGIAAIAYALMTLPPNQDAAGEMLQRSLPQAHGYNVVNVILVDFRGFDTFGEITVFGIAALVVHAMLRRSRLAPEQIMPGPPVKLPVPADLTQILFPLTLTVSIFLFLRGHNAPGGGFVAGLVLAVPLLMQYVIQGTASVESRFGFDYIRCIGTGLFFALFSGAGAMLFGVPFLTSGHVDFAIPLLGTLSVVSAVGFDTGVYLVVFGGVMLIMSMIGTIKPHRRRNARYGEIDLWRRSPRTGEMH